MKLLVAISLITLCLASNSFAENSPNPKDLQKINNTEYIFGNKDQSIATFVYKEFKNKQLDKQIIFFVNKFPYEEKFNLCEAYEKNLPQCDSHIKIQNISAQKIPYFTEFSFMFPQSQDLKNNKLFGLTHYSVENFSVGNGYKLEMPHEKSVFTFEILDN